MSVLSELNRRLSNLQDKKRQLEKELKIQNQRLQDVEKISKSLKATNKEEVEFINRFVVKINEYMLEAVIGNRNFSNCSYEISNEAENGIDTDTYLSAASTNLSNEISKVKAKIVDLIDEINRTNMSITYTQRDIANEERRIAEEERRAEEARREEARRAAEAAKRIPATSK